MQVGIYNQNAPVLFGAGTFAQVGEKAKELEMTKVFLVTDKGIAALGHPDRAAKFIEEAGLEVKVWDGAIGDCPTDNLKVGAAMAREFGADGLVAIGGGSSMDTAKALGGIIPNGDEVLNDIIGYLTGAKKFAKPILPVISIPTTAGTGSETTRMAVLNDKDLDMKVGFPAVSTLAIVDPELTVGSPAGLTALCGMDAFAHAAESLCAKGCTAHTDMCAYEAIRHISKWLPVAVEDKMNLEAREHMSFASNIAGIAFSEDNCHIGHAIAHIVGHRFGIPHGLAVAVNLPAVIEFSAKEHPGKVRGLGEAMGVDVSGVSDEQIGVTVANALREFMKGINVPTLADKEVSHDELMGIAEEALGAELTAYYDGTVTIDDINAVLDNSYDWR